MGENFGEGSQTVDLSAVRFASSATVAVGFELISPGARMPAGPVSSGERGRLVEEKQLGVITAPDVALAVLEVEHAADPLPRRPAPPGQLLIVGVEASATIAHEQAARGRRKQLAKRIDAVLQ